MEYIKKSDVEQYLITWRNLDIIRGLQDLPTINLSIIDEMIEEVRNNPEFKGKSGLDARGATAICYLKMAGEQMKSTPIHNKVTYY